MHKITRETMLGEVKYDDLQYVNTLVLALSRSAGISQKEIAEAMSEEQLAVQFRVAEASHSFPFEGEVEELSQILFGENRVKKTPTFIDAWEDSVIFTALLTELFYETGKTIVELWKLVYQSVLSEWCVDKNSAWSITPTNVLLVESFEILGLEEYYDRNRVYT